MSQKLALTDTQDAPVYRSGNSLLVLTDDIVILSVDGAEYYEVGITERLDTTMHIHVPGLDILVALLRKTKDADAYSILGMDAIYPTLGQQPFVRTDETFDGKYNPLPDFVPLAAFLAQQPSSWGTAYVMAILDIATRDYSVYLIDGSPYTPKGATGTKQELTRPIASVGIAAVSFRLNGYDYSLANSPYDSGPRYTCNNQEIAFHDAEQFHIVVSDDGNTVTLTPLAHANKS